MGTSLPFLPSKIQLNKICNSSQEVFISLAGVIQISSSLGKSWACLGIKTRGRYAVGRLQNETTKKQAKSSTNTTKSTAA